MDAKQYAVALIILALLDGSWIKLNMTFYQDSIKAVQKHPLRVNPGAAAAAYVCIYGLLVLFAIPAVNPRSTSLFMDAARHGGLLGLLTYGVYNFTCMSIYSDYALDVALRDTLWGGVLFTLVTYATLKLS
jgi:hypothetical protein